MNKEFWVILSFLLLFCFATQNTYADYYADSVKQELIHANDSIHAKVLLKAAKHYIESNPDSALHYAQLAYNFVSKNKLNNVALESTIALARSYQGLSKYYKSTTYYIDAAKLAETTKNNSRLATIYNGLGINYFYLLDYEKSVNYLGKAAEVKLANNEIKEYSTIVVNMASVLHTLGKDKEAIASLNYAEEKLLPLKETENILSNIYNAFGSIYQVGKNDIDSAIFFYSKALEMAQIYKVDIFLLSANINLGLAYLKKNELQQSEKYLLTGLLYAKRIKSNVSEISLYESLSNLSAKRDNYEQALAYKILQMRLKDSLFVSERDNSIAKLETQYQNEKNRTLINQQRIKLKEEKTQILYLIIGFILTSVLGLSIFILMKFKSRLNKRVEQAKEVFFSNVVHEIRTPLSMIIAPLALLKDKINETEKSELIETAIKNASHLELLIGQMLTVSKLDANAYKINNYYANFDEVLMQITDNFKSQSNLKKQSFETNFEIEYPYFEFDFDALEKIIYNLLTNASKYTTHKGKIGLEVKTLNSQLQIMVWDNGEGIDTKNQQKVFERFYQAEKGKQVEQNGIGIGLSMVKSIVMAMNGSIDLQSELNKGSVFTVHLPIAPNTNQVEPALNQLNATVLLVEDDLEILKFNKKQLENIGLNVLTAQNGESASTLIANELPDVIVSDLMMPVKNGFELLKEIKENNATSHIPFIILSAKSSPTEKLEAMRLGAQVYLTKPFLPQELLLLIQNQLKIVELSKGEFQNTLKKESLSLEERFAGKDNYTIKFFELLFKNIDNSEFTIEQFAELMATNRSHFQRKIKAITGNSPSELLKMVRLEKSKELLLKGEGNITEIAYKCGFSSQSYFTKSFNLYFGKSPSKFLSENEKLT